MYFGCMGDVAALIRGCYLAVWGIGGVLVEGGGV